MNAQEFLDLADTIEAADRFDLNVYADWRDDSVDKPAVSAETLVHDCGTAGCISGWENARHGANPEDEGFARRALGITSDESYRLFFAWSNSVWVELAHEYGWKTGHYGLNPWDQITASQAADVLRRIARGEVTL